MLYRIALVASVSAILSLAVTASPSKSGPDPVRHDADHGETARKGDRLLAPVSGGYRSPVASIMRSGDGQRLSVSMRDPLGKVVYFSDASAGVTAVVRDANYIDLSVDPTPATRRVVAQAVGKVPVGCDRAVSVLTGSAAARRASRCIT